MNKIIIGVIAIIAIIGSFFLLNAYIYEEKQATAGVDPKNAEYLIEGVRVQLVNGEASAEAAPGSASMVVTRYFGNEVVADLNDDGRQDAVFLLTQETGGSGVFFYVVAALNTDRGYVGSQALFLGDRIAPQTTHMSLDPSHKNVVVVNYADRAPGEPMTARPSEGKSIWLKLDTQSMQFGEVVQNFEGEADPSRMTLDMKEWAWVSAQTSAGAIAPKTADKFTLTFGSDGTFSAKTDCNGIGGSYSAAGVKLTFSKMMSTLMYCEGSQESVYSELLQFTQGYHFTGKGELVLELASGGTATFR
jgi:heat shock protein HslJ